MDGKNISYRRCSEELWSFTSCSRRTQVRPQHWPRTCQRGIRSGCNPRQFLRFFGMHLSRKIFSVSEQFSRTLQTKDISMSDALKAVDITLSSFRNQRRDVVFDQFYDSVVLVLSAGKKHLILRHRKSERQRNSSTLQILQPHMCTQPQKITLDTHTMKQ